jgi:UDP-N-acetylmuramoyl-L-alanyl-D-glutamate--2,6-diaminopimelate ligase
MQQWRDNFMLLDSVNFSSQQLQSALQLLGIDCALLSSSALATSDISLDSRESKASTAFVALKGSLADGHDFIKAAIEQDCKLVLCERAPQEALLIQAKKADASIVAIDDLKLKLAQLLRALFLHNVDTAQTVISAVTGTNGKTSVASLYAQLGAQEHASSASLGTLGLNILSAAVSPSTRKPESLVSTEHHDLGVNTTPDIITHYKVLRLLAERKVADYCLEASSHGIEQGRLAGLPIDTVIFTNLTQDHLDYHGSMDAYASAKRAILKHASITHIVLNADDAESQNWAQHLPNNAQVAWYGVGLTDAASSNIPEGASHYCIASNLSYNANGIAFNLNSSWGSAQVCLPLFGAFNVANTLAALCAQLLHGKDFDALVNKISCLKGVPGRMELFVPLNKVSGHGTQPSRAQHGNLIVDYAHTPDALTQSLRAAREHTEGTLFCVFGCGGDRDKSKRPMMAAAASRNSDSIVITQDNSRSESPEAIAQDVLKGIDKDKKVHVELDRKQAIRWAYQSSTEHDLILVAGKGHERYLEINHQRLPYDERQFVATLCKESCND